MVRELDAKMTDVLKKFGAGATATKDESLEGFYQLRRANAEHVKSSLQYDFSKNATVLEHGLVLIPITDVHLGNRHANVPYFKAFVKYILETPNCYTILNGDLAETATKISVGMGHFEEDVNLPGQLQMLHEILLPLAEAGKILGMGPGNHEERVANMIGINPMSMLAEKLKVPYFGYQGFFSLKVGDVRYTMVAHHGAGGGGTNGSKANASEKMNKVCGNADVYFSGHTHGKMYHPDKIFLFDDEGNLAPRLRHYIVGGSFVEYFGGYPEMKALAPSITGLTRIQLMPDVRDVRVTV